MGPFNNSSSLRSTWQNVGHQASGISGTLKIINYGTLLRTTLTASSSVSGGWSARGLDWEKKREEWEEFGRGKGEFNIALN